MLHAGYTASPVATSIPFDNTTNGFASTNVQDAVNEAKVAAAGTLPSDYITAPYTVPLHQQLILSQRLTIASGGSLIVQGKVRIL
jgi:hypothetical protein